MENTVTKEEVERVLKNEIGHATSSIRDILNELFPPEFKIGDWVVTDSNHVREIRSVSKDRYTFTTGSYVRLTEVKRHATTEEIAAAEWEEGKPYKVWIDNDVEEVRISADKVGYFYSCATFEGDVHEWKNYEKL